MPEAYGNPGGVWGEPENIKAGIAVVAIQHARVDSAIQCRHGLGVAPGVVLGRFAEDIRDEGFEAGGFFRPEDRRGVPHLYALP